jgi:uncharacterized damage-inducible protein DinB
VSTPIERDVLLRYLAAQRRHVMAVVDGLSEEQMLLTPLPSGWSPTTLLNHLALDDEQFWFLCVIAGDQSAIESLSGDGWTLPSDVSPRKVHERYQQITQSADEVLAAVDLDAAPAWWPGDLFGEWRLETNREVLLHALTEISCHAGHLDAARELIDGRQHLVF